MSGSSDEKKKSIRTPGGGLRTPKKKVRIHAIACIDMLQFSSLMTTIDIRTFFLDALRAHTVDHSI